MGFVGTEHGAETRDAAKQHHVALLQGYLNNADDVAFTEYFDDSEGIVWGLWLVMRLS